MIAKQITDPARGKRACEPDCVAMPKDLVKGEDINNVAAYVAQSVGKPGKDEGILANAVKAPGSDKPAVVKGGVLSIPADPGGQLAYLFKAATAKPGSFSVESPNKASIVHDIVIDDKGKGATVKDGGVSKFTANFAAGSYDYYCSVPGHREAGMEGKLTVK